MSIRLALGDQTFPLLPHTKMLDVAALLGFDAVDFVLAGGRSQLVVQEIREDVSGWAGRLDERLRTHGLLVADVFVLPWTDFQTLAPNHPDAAERARSRELFLDMLDLASRLEAPGMTILPGVTWEGEPPQDSLARCAEELSWRAAQARARGLRFSVEAHIGSVIEDPADIVTLMETSDGVELTLDYGHFISRGMPQEALHQLIPHARHFHARCSRPDRLQSSMKENTIDFEQVIDRMIDSGYDGYLGLEYVWIDWEHCNEVDNLAETLLLKGRLEAKLAGRDWTYSESPI